MFIIANEIRVYGDHIFSCLLLFTACYLVYSYNKTNEMQNLKNLFLE
jgi:hypothetical protein